jgi:hypothetical protein
MGAAFGEARVIAASADSKRLMKQLVTKGIFDEQRDVWRLGAALGISLGEVHRLGVRGTFQNVNSLDPEEVFAAVMLGRYPKLKPEERLKMLVDHAEWGIREISRRVANGTFSPASFALPPEPGGKPAPT